MRRRPIPLLVLALALLLLAAACGGEETVTPTPETVEGTLPEETTEESPAETLEGDASAGEEVFASAGCGGCHVLQAAGTNGQVGPNLDEAQPDFELAYDRVSNGQGAMPSFEDQLTEQQIADVAAFVAENAGS
jgi:sulfite dehydrogenase